MDQLLYVPTADELFDYGDGGREAHTLAEQLRQRGWPTTARIIGGSRDGWQVSGQLVELIDALPLLVQDSADLPPEFSVWGELGRLALTMVAEGRLRPQLLPKTAHEHDPRIEGWSASWIAAPDAREQSSEAQLAGLLLPQVALPLGRLSRAAQLQRPPSPTRIARRMLDATCDVLVREAEWRGALVRIGDWPAESFEQRLVRALTESHARLALDAEDPPELAAELNSWAEDGAEGPLLLPSPPSWRAPEPLEQVLQRIILPATRLARHLLAGHDAPRSL